MSLHHRRGTAKGSGRNGGMLPINPLGIPQMQDSVYRED